MNWLRLRRENEIKKFQYYMFTNVHTHYEDLRARVNERKGARIKQHSPTFRTKFFLHFGLEKSSLNAVQGLTTPE